MNRLVFIAERLRNRCSGLSRTDACQQYTDFGALDFGPIGLGTAPCAAAKPAQAAPRGEFIFQRERNQYPHGNSYAAAA